MAVTNAAATGGFSPWTWLVATGDATTPAILVAKKADDSNPNAWVTQFTSALGSAPDAVSWSDGTTAFQRIFYAKNGTMEMLTWDANAFGSTSVLPMASGFNLVVGDVAALTWVNGTTRTLAAVGYAAKNGVNGHLCFWEKPASSGTWTTSCTGTPMMSGDNTSALPDIVGVVQGTTPLFFFRNANGHPARARRTGPAAYTIEEINTNTSIGRSMFATVSQASGSIDVGMIFVVDNKVHIARLSSTTSTNPTWTTLPSLGTNILPAITNNAALGGASYSTSQTGTKTQVSVLSTAARLFTIHTTNNTGTTWEAAWSAGVVPGNGNTTAPEQVLFALGPTIGSPAGNGARLFLVGVGAVSTSWASTLQEYWSGFPSPFRDHVRMFSGTDGIKTGTTGATEASTGGGPVLGVAAAIQRNSPPTPWKILVSGTNDNGTSFDNPLTLTPQGGAAFSASDPVAVHAGTGGHLLHFANLEMMRGTTSDCPATANSYKIVFRRGFTASDIASTYDFVIASSGHFDHPGLGVTVDSSDGATAHVVYWDLANYPDSHIQYWILSPTDVVSGPFQISNDPMAGGLPGNPPGIVVGNMQSIVYGWTYPNESVGWPTICKMNGSQTSGLTCGTPSGTPPPQGYIQFPFGSPIAQTAAGDCNGISDGNGNTRFFKCFDVREPMSVAASPTQPDQLYIAYQSTTGGHTAIFFTRNVNSNLQTWLTTPVQIVADSTQELINPAITVDYEGTIVVTYSRIVKAGFNGTDGAATVLVRYSTDNGATWSSLDQVVSNWNANSLPFHCERRHWFLGEYRRADVVANRAEHIVPFSVTGGVLQQYAMWFSRWFNLKK